MMSIPLRLAAVALLLMLSASAAQAGGPITPSGVLTSKPLNADGSIRSFSGPTSPFGNVYGALAIKVQPDFSFFGPFTLVTRSGSAYGIILGQFISPTNYVERLYFLGGTGSLCGVSGYADVFGTVDPTNGNGTDVIFDGQIFLP